MSFLPGMFPAAAAAAAPLVLTSISLFGSATSSLATIDAPASIIAGDLLVLLDRAEDASQPPPVSAVPSGFTSIIDLTIQNEVRQILSYKLAVGTEGGATLTGMTGDSAIKPFFKALYVFRGNAPATAITVSTPTGEATDDAIAPQDVLAGSGVAPLIGFGAYGADTPVDPRIFTVGGIEAKDGELSSTTALYLAYKIYNTAPADIVIDMDDEVRRNILQGVYIEMA